METTLNLNLVREHISINFKSNKFEFKLFPHKKSPKYDIDYYPIVSPKSSDGIPQGVVKCIASLITAQLSKLKEISKLDIDGIIFTDLFSDLPKKTYKIWNERNIYLGDIKTVAPEDKLNDILLTYNKNAAYYLEED